MSTCPGCGELIHDSVEVCGIIGVVGNNKGSIVHCGNKVECFEAALELLKSISNPQKFRPIRRIPPNGEARN